MTPEDFQTVAAELRPRLHRYAARMVGSAFDGEDVVQDAMVRAAMSLPAAVERPEAWLFRIVHNVAIDALRRRARQAEAFGMDTDDVADPSGGADSRVAATAGLQAFLALPVLPRACVVLSDVLGYSDRETAEVLDTSLAGVKAALHRGRERLKAAAAQPDAPATPLLPAARARLAAYADRFNARDFDALRDLLAEDVRLDLANRLELRGRKDVAVYFHRYEDIEDRWRVSVGLAEGRPALLYRPAQAPDGPVAYVVLLDFDPDGRIVQIRDFRYAGYAIEGVPIVQA
jgi:RNA polymerase sigma-70 factor (ECF subfamily)